MNSSLNVGYVLKKYPRLSETFILNEILGLEEQGVSVSIFSLRLPDEGRFHAELADVKASVTYLAAPRSNAPYVLLRDLVQRVGASSEGIAKALTFLESLPESSRAPLLVQAVELAAAVRERPIGHLHAHFMTIAAHAAYLAHLLTGVSFSVTAHAKDVYRTTVNASLFALIADAARAVVTVCDANRNYIARNLVSPNARIATIYNGVDRRTFSTPVDGRDPRLILAVGRLVPKKGFDDLLRACALLKHEREPFRCIIAGDGEEQASLQTLARELDLTEQVEFLGAVPRDRVLTLMREARVLVAPCVRGDDGNQDALPTVLIEALASGLPVVTTPVAGIPEIADDGEHGFIVESGDPSTLADRIQHLLSHDRTWQQMSDAGPHRVAERFDRNHTLTQLRQVFTSEGTR